MLHYSYVVDIYLYECIFICSYVGYKITAV
nr:MAG TPA: hypothetical protein [Caudoviricetes sp.]